MVFTIEVHEIPPFVEDSHLIMFPVYPLKVNIPLFDPEQTVAALAIVPPTETGETLIVAGLEFSAAHIPL